MPRLDLVLLHPPSVYDFRRRAFLYGPISDLIPSSPVFEMYPLGFASIAEYLERAGYRVRIVNLAVRMLNDPDFDPERLVKGLRARAFGIDLHWLPHAQGALEVARLVKRHHPEAKLVMGGLSASYYYRELMEHPEVDYVLRGDSAEEPLRQLMGCLAGGKEPAEVPNLVWREASGRAQENPMSYVPQDLGEVMDGYYDNTLRSVVRYRDLASYVPFQRWLRYPITAVLTCRGCTRNCVFCGGSAAAYRLICHRPGPAFRTPEAVAEDVKSIQGFSRGPIFILGDIRQPGDGYAERLLGLLDEARVKNQVIMELFTPAPAELLRRMGEACPGFCLEVSPESHDPLVRRASGKSYSNQELEETLGHALAAGCGRLDVFFMIGLPRQTPGSVMDTIDYCGHLMERFKGERRLHLFISPLAPFLDPGSLGFENPERYGYRLLSRTLAEHAQALLSPSWKHALNYETEWMDRHQLVATTYEAGLQLNHLKARYGLVPKGVAQATEQRTRAALEMIHRLDEMIARGDGDELPRLKAEVDRLNLSPVWEKGELELPMGAIKLKPIQALRSLVRSRR